MKHYIRDNREGWRNAIPPLASAANLCPVPDPKQPIPPVRFSPFVSYPYLPFYYLGLCYDGLADFPNALRHFYLSACAGEQNRGGERAEKLPSLTDSCKQRFESKSRPGKNLYFQDGSKAINDENWMLVADKMWEALQLWREDGLPVSDSPGRPWDSYLPRYHLAKALFYLECYREAADQFDRSWTTLRGNRFKNERAEIEKHFKPKCAQKISGGYKEKEICQRWGCWLREGVPATQ